MGRKIAERMSEIKAGIKSVLFWLPIIWKDRWYDWDFLMMIIEHKLLQMGHATRAHGCQESSQKKAAQMLVCADLCKKIYTNKYRQDELEFHKGIWGDCVCPVCGEFICDCFRSSDDESYWVNLYENVKTRADDEMASAQMMRILEAQETDLETDIELLFYIMKEKLRGWWD